MTIKHSILGKNKLKITRLSNSSMQNRLKKTFSVPKDSIKTQFLEKKRKRKKRLKNIRALGKENHLLESDIQMNMLDL